MADPLIEKTIRHLEVGNIEAADGSFTDYYKKYIRSNTKNAVRSSDEIKSDLDLLVPYVSAFPSKKNSFGAAHSNLFKRQQASGDWNKYVLRTMISHAYSDIGVKKNPLASAPKGIAVTKRKLNNRSALVMPVARVARVAPVEENANNTGNINNDDYPYTGKIVIPVPNQYRTIGTLKINRRGAPTNNANVQVVEPPAKKPKTNHKYWTYESVNKLPIMNLPSVSNDPALQGIASGMTYEEPTGIISNLEGLRSPIVNARPTVMLPNYNGQRLGFSPLLGQAPPANVPRVVGLPLKSRFDPRGPLSPGGFLGGKRRSMRRRSRSTRRRRSTRRKH
jgi:hypothetical protein